MENFLIIILDVFLTIAPVAVYLDATQQKIGKIGKKSFLNMPAGAWGAAALIIPIIALPLYLIKRRALIANAKENPVHIGTTQRAIVGFVLLAFGITLTLLSLIAFEPAA